MDPRPDGYVLVGLNVFSGGVFFNVAVFIQFVSESVFDLFGFYYLFFVDLLWTNLDIPNRYDQFVIIVGIFHLRVVVDGPRFIHFVGIDLQKITFQFPGNDVVCMVVQVNEHEISTVIMRVAHEGAAVFVIWINTF